MCGKNNKMIAYLYIMLLILTSSKQYLLQIEKMVFSPKSQWAEGFT